MRMSLVTIQMSCKCWKYSSDEGKKECCRQIGTISNKIVVGFFDKISTLWIRLNEFFLLDRKIAFSDRNVSVLPVAHV